MNAHGYYLVNNGPRRSVFFYANIYYISTHSPFFLVLVRSHPTELFSHDVFSNCCPCLRKRRNVILCHAPQSFVKMCSPFFLSPLFFWGGEEALKPRIGNTIWGKRSVGQEGLLKVFPYSISRPTKIPIF